MRRRPLSRPGRVRVRVELPLRFLPRRDRLGVQADRRHQRELVEITDGGEALLIVGEEDDNHTRCASCGSLLFSVVRDGAYVHVALGSLADLTELRPTAHIWVSRKAPWFEIADDSAPVRGVPELAADAPRRNPLAGGQDSETWLSRAISLRAGHGDADIRRTSRTRNQQTTEGGQTC